MENRIQDTQIQKPAIFRSLHFPIKIDFPLAWIQFVIMLVLSEAWFVMAFNYDLLMKDSLAAAIIINSLLLFRAISSTNKYIANN